MSAVEVLDWNSRNKPVPNYELKFTTSERSVGISSIKFSPDGQLLASGSYDTVIEILRSSDGTCQQQMNTYPAVIGDIAWSRDGKLLCAACSDHKVKVWDVATAKLLHTLKGHKSHVYTCTFSPIADLMVSGGFDGCMRIWDVRSGRSLRTIPAHPYTVSSVDFNSDGSLLLSGSCDGLPRLWDGFSGKNLRTLIDDDEDGYGAFAKFSPNGKYAISSSLDNAVRMWDLANGKVVRRYVGHDNQNVRIGASIPAICQNHVVCGSENSRVYIWNMDTQKTAQVLIGHTGAVVSIACHPCKAIIATATFDSDRCVKVWSGEIEEGVCS